MVEKRIYAGSLNHRVSIYHTEGGNASTTGETLKADTLIGPIQSNLQDGGGNESEDGKVFYLANRIYTIRFVDLIWKKGHQMFVRDEDGDYQIYSVELIGNKEYLKLKCSKRE